MSSKTYGWQFSSPTQYIRSGVHRDGFSERFYHVSGLPRATFPWLPGNPGSSRVDDPPKLPRA